MSNVDDALVKFKCPATWMICGPTSSGKTTLVKQILLNAAGLFEVPPHQIIYSYSIWQPLYQELQDRIRNITFIQGLPCEEDFKANNGLHSICVIDDNMSHASESKMVEDLFCIRSHHLNWTTMVVVQNIYYRGKVMRTISLNSLVFVFFKNSRDELQISTIARQMFPQNTAFFMVGYRQAVSRPHGYIVVDIIPGSNKKYQL